MTGRRCAAARYSRSTYHLTGEPHGPYQYGRLTNPTWSAWEAALGELEAGEVVSFSSGIAAVSAVLQSTLRPATFS